MIASHIFLIILFPSITNIFNNTPLSKPEKKNHFFRFCFCFSLVLPKNQSIVPTPTDNIKWYDPSLPKFTRKPIVMDEARRENIRACTSQIQKLINGSPLLPWFNKAVEKIKGTCYMAFHVGMCILVVSLLCRCITQSVWLCLLFLCMHAHRKGTAYRRIYKRAGVETACSCGYGG